MFLTIVFVVGVVSGATAAVSGFGIGSLLTPLLALRLGVADAVVAVTIPHALATGLRTWRLRRAIDTRVLRSFGLLSAAGGLVGALAHGAVSQRALTIVLGALLVATTVAVLTDWARRWTVTGPASSVLGFASGLFGGLAGNQGGLRAAALMTQSLSPAQFVATATATGLLVDAVRTPIYLSRTGGEILGYAWPIGIATVGTIVGTLLGERMLLGLAPERFRRIVAGLIGLLGVWLLMGAVTRG
jgi:uncharacterized membrane protein YfcA